MEVLVITGVCILPSDEFGGRRAVSPSDDVGYYRPIFAHNGRWTATPQADRISRRPGGDSDSLARPEPFFCPQAYPSYAWKSLLRGKEFQNLARVFRGHGVRTPLLAQNIHILVLRHISQTPKYCFYGKRIKTFGSRIPALKYVCTIPSRAPGGFVPLLSHNIHLLSLKTYTRCLKIDF